MHLLTGTWTANLAKSRAIVGSVRYEVSEDGGTLKATMSGFDASGRHFEQEIVFDRV